MKLDDLFFASILAIISFIAGIIGLINRAEHKTKERLKDKLLFIGVGGASSVLIGFITYEVSFYILENQRLCLAISAFCAWMDTRLLLEAQTRALDFIKNYKKEN